MIPQGLLKDLEGVPLETEASVLRRKSRDYFWYSPVLKRLLDGVLADLVACPRDEAEVVRVLQACHAHRVPVTARGAGTGNYGQAMPLSGGLVLDLHHLAQVDCSRPGRVVAGPGANIAAVNVALRSAREYWLMPLVTTRPASLVAATTVPPGHMQKLYTARPFSAWCTSL